MKGDAYSSNCTSRILSAENIGSPFLGIPKSELLALRLLRFLILSTLFSTTCFSTSTATDTFVLNTPHVQSEDFSSKNLNTIILSNYNNERNNKWKRSIEENVTSTTHSQVTLTKNGHFNVSSLLNINLIWQGSGGVLFSTYYINKSGDKEAKNLTYIECAFQISSIGATYTFQVSNSTLDYESVHDHPPAMILTGQDGWPYVIIAFPEEKGEYISLKVYKIHIIGNDVKVEKIEELKLQNKETAGKRAIFRSPTTMIEKGNQLFVISRVDEDERGEGNKIYVKWTLNYKNDQYSISLPENTGYMNEYLFRYSSGNANVDWNDDRLLVDVKNDSKTEINFLYVAQTNTTNSSYEILYFPIDYDKSVGLGCLISGTCNPAGRGRRLASNTGYYVRSIKKITAKNITMVAYVETSTERNSDSNLVLLKLSEPNWPLLPPEKYIISNFSTNVRFLQMYYLDSIQTFEISIVSDNKVTAFSIHPNFPSEATIDKKTTNNNDMPSLFEFFFVLKGEKLMTSNETITMTFPMPQNSTETTTTPNSQLQPSQTTVSLNNTEAIPNPNDFKSKNDSVVGTIVISVIGVLILLFVVIGSLAWYFKRRQQPYTVLEFDMEDILPGKFNKDGEYFEDDRN